MTARRHLQWSEGAAGPVLAFADRGELAWQARALCAEIGGDHWFPGKHDSTAPAKLICARCEVKAECLAYALDHKIRHGVWGGMSKNQRRRLRAAREVAA